MHVKVGHFSIFNEFTLLLIPLAKVGCTISNFYLLRCLIFTDKSLWISCDQTFAILHLKGYIFIKASLFSFNKHVQRECETQSLAQFLILTFKKVISIQCPSVSTVCSLKSHNL